MIEGHGDDLFRFNGKVRINFSTNIPQNVDHNGLLNYLHECGAIFRNYPEPEPRSVEARLSEIFGLAQNKVIVTNGATEAIYLLAHLYTGGKSEIIVPTFMEYQDAARVFGHSVSFVGSIDEIGKSDARIIWLCNPNNPTGRVYDRAKLLATADSCHNKLFVIDQAYADYSVEPVLSMDDMATRTNIVLLGSMTKRFTVPGLRIGYAVGPKDIIEGMRNLRMPWSVNAMAIKAAHYLLSHRDDYLIDFRTLHDEARRLAAGMRVLGIDTGDTDCNFLLARVPGRNVSELKQWLVDSHGILIRDASNFEGLGQEYFRVAARNRQENDILIEALKEWMFL